MDRNKLLDEIYCRLFLLFLLDLAIELSIYLMVSISLLLMHALFNTPFDSTIRIIGFFSVSTLFKIYLIIKK